MATTILLLGNSDRLAAAPLVVTPQLWVSEQYNDNVFFTKNPVDDFITSVTPGLTLEYRQPRLTAFLGVSNSAQIFAHETSENSGTSSQFGILSVSYRPTPRLRFTINDAVNRVEATRTGTLPLISEPAPPPGEQPEPVEPPPPSFEASTLLPRGEALSNFFGAQASYAFSPVWSGIVSYSNGLSDFTNPGARDLSNSVGLQMNYHWSPELTFDAAYSYTRFNLTDAPDTQTQTVTVGAAYAPAETWFVRGFAGLYINDATGGGSSDGVSNDVGPTFSITLSKAFEHGSALIGAAQGITSSAGVGGVSQTTSVFGQYRQDFTRDLSGYVGATHSRFDLSPGHFNIAVANVGLSYRVWRFISVGLSYSYQRSDSNQAVSNGLQSGVVDGNLVSLSVNAFYPVRSDL